MSTCWDAAAHGDVSYCAACGWTDPKLVIIGSGLVDPLRANLHESRRSERMHDDEFRRGYEAAFADLAKAWDRTFPKEEGEDG